MPSRPLLDRSAATGAALMAASALGFSVMTLLVKQASAELPTMEIVFARSLVMTAAAVAGLARAGIPLFGVDRPTLLARGAVGTTALSLLYWGVGRMPLGDATAVHYTAPVWTALTASWLLGERVPRAVMASVAASLAGVWLVARPTGGGAPPLVVAGVVAAAVLSGLAYTFVRKLRATDAPLTIILYLSGVGVVASLPFALAGGWRVPTFREGVVLAGIGLATWTGQWCLTHGLHRLRAAPATAIGYVQIVFAYGWGVLVFGETPTAAALVGAGLVLASVLLVMRYGVQTARPPRDRAGSPPTRPHRLGTASGPGAA